MWDIATLSKTGGRTYNQDYLACSAPGKGVCLVVADGLGSYEGSEMASMTACNAVVNWYNEASRLDIKNLYEARTLNAVIFNAHGKVQALKEAEANARFGCTTVACLITDGTHTVTAHIGDTRIYYFHESTIAFQTRDHSLAQLAVDRGEILARNVRTHEDQNKLTRVLGSDYFIPPDNHVFETPLATGDAFLLCTDGLWEYVFEEEMETILSEEADAAAALSRMEALLLTRVAPNHDNYSAVLLRVTDDPATAPKDDKAEDDKAKDDKASEEATN